MQVADLMASGVSGPLLPIAQAPRAFLPRLLAALKQLPEHLPLSLSAVSEEAPAGFQARCSRDPIMLPSRPPFFALEKEIPVSRWCGLIKQ